MSLAIGIDLGTTNSVAAVATATGVEFTIGGAGERIHPSVVAFPAAGGVLVGLEAATQRAVDPANTVCSAKRLIGQNMRAPLVQLALSSLPYRIEEGPNQQPIIVVGGRRQTVPEISAQVIRYLKRLAEKQFGEPITQAVITVPANFSDAQRQATKEAGRIAGVDVLRLVNEPTAAALAYGYGQTLDELVAVFDFGGGTFDISILKIKSEIFEVIATDGDFFLGGDDIDRTLAEFLAAELNRSQGVDPRPFPVAMTRLMMAAEQIKCHLSAATTAEGVIDQLVVESRPEPLALSFSISRAQFENLITGYVDRTVEVCRNVMVAANLEFHQLSEVICVGGSTRVPLVRQRIAELFQREPSIGINPDEVVGHGAAVQAATLSGHLDDAAPAPQPSALATMALPGQAPPPVADPAQPSPASQPLPVRRDVPVLMDVTPASLRIATAGGYSEVILEKNAPIPIEHSKVFSPAHNDQPRVVIECCRGEARAFEDNEALGSLTLEGLPPATRAETRIEVTFRIDADGILQVRATDLKSGQAQEATLTVIGAPSAADGPRPDLSELFALDSLGDE